jgi:hypothetical protein
MVAEYGEHARREALMVVERIESFAAEIELDLPFRDTKCVLRVRSPIARLVAYVRFTTRAARYEELATLIAGAAPGHFVAGEYGEFALWVHRRVRQLVQDYLARARRMTASRGCSNLEQMLWLEDDSQDYYGGEIRPTVGVVATRRPRPRVPRSRRRAG